MANHPAQDPKAVYWRDDDPAVPVFQRPTEFEALLSIYRQRRPRRILEVGTYYGGTLKQWLKTAPPGAVVVSIDTYAHPQADNRHRYGEWTPAGVELSVLAGRSDDPAIIAAVQALAPFDWIFIDADHTYPAVCSDWYAYRAMAAPGAVVAFHDILTHAAHPEIEVGRLWGEIIAAGYHTEVLIEDAAAKWGGIGVVYL